MATLSQASIGILLKIYLSLFIFLSVTKCWVECLLPVLLAHSSSLLVIIRTHSCRQYTSKIWLTVADYSESEDVVDSGYCTSESSDDQNSPSLSEPIHPPPYDNGVAVMLVFHPQIQLVPVCFATCGPILHPPSLPNCVPSADSPASIPAPRLRKNCRRVIKWSLPPPSSAPLSLPGWQPMP